tara:strand:- start:1256 stop:1387 length:132 start_codon:yes stop_codon:yes gene_type:complete
MDNEIFRRSVERITKSGTGFVLHREDLAESFEESGATSRVLRP